MNGRRGPEKEESNNFARSVHFGTDVRMPDVAYTPRDTDRGCRLNQRGRIAASPLFPPLLLRLINSLVEALNAELSIERCEMNIPARRPVGLADRPTPDFSGCMSTISTTMETCNVLTQLREEILTVVMCFLVSDTRTLCWNGLEPGSGSSSEEEVDFTCPERGCRKRFRSRSTWTAHAEWHREERSISKYLAKR
ncbi:Zinc finger C2H2-type/integrase DNA-binding domain [Phytophthora cactorum]|nr:Zinc finger C2H2-type/integrase DNA-binding domain [Phytophthora cactorum]